MWVGFKVKNIGFFISDYSSFKKIFRKEKDMLKWEIRSKQERLIVQKSLDSQIESLEYDCGKDEKWKMINRPRWEYLRTKEY